MSDRYVWEFQILNHDKLLEQLLFTSSDKANDFAIAAIKRIDRDKYLLKYASTREQKQQMRKYCLQSLRAAGAYTYAETNKYKILVKKTEVR